MDMYALVHVVSGTLLRIGDLDACRTAAWLSPYYSKDVCCVRVKDGRETSAYN